MYLVAAVTNILTDIALVYFPLPIIWSLQLYRAQKLSVYAFFVCAGRYVFESSPAFHTSWNIVADLCSVTLISVSQYPGATVPNSAALY